MSTILCTSDLHLTSSPTEAYRHDFMAGLYELIQTRKPDALAILGDLTQEKDRHPADLVNRVVAEISDLASLVPIAIMMGNHDYQNEGSPFFAFLKHLPNVEWVGSPAIASRALNSPALRKIFDGCIFLPHTRNHEVDWAEVEHDFGNARFIFAHNTFNGAEVGWGRKLEGIPLDVFPNKARVISGDIHVPQTLGPVTYVGAPYTVNFGDDYKPRLLMLDDLKMKSISVASWPQKRLVEVDDLAALAKVKHVRTGDIIKVRIGMDDMGNWGSVHADVRAWAEAEGYHLVRAEPVLDKPSIKKRIKVVATESDPELMRAYAKRHGLEAATLKAGLEFVK